jgi:hypothetical protein
VTWQHLVSALQAGRHWARWAFLPFFRWYAPRLDLYAQAVSRVDEFEADALAAAATDSMTAACALVRLDVTRLHLVEEVLPSVYRLSAERREPPHDIAQRVADALRRPPDGPRVERWVQQALAAETLDRDTHPSLFRRVERLTGHTDRAAVTMTTLGARAGEHGERAADVMFGRARLEKLRQRLSDSWQREILDSWNRWHASARLWRGSGVAAEGEPLDVAWARAWWSACCEPPSVAIPMLDRYVTRDPGNADAMVTLGKLLIERPEPADQERGVRLLEAAHESDTEVALDACAALEAWYSRHGPERAPDVIRIQTRSRQLEHDVWSSLAERSRLTVDDMLVAHQLPDATLSIIRRACGEESRIKRALIVRKHVRYLADQPCVVLVVEPDVPWYKPAFDTLAADVAADLHQRLMRANVLDLIVLGGEPGSRLLGHIRAIPGAEIYTRET